MELFSAVPAAIYSKERVFLDFLKNIKISIDNGFWNCYNKATKQE